MSDGKVQSVRVELIIFQHGEICIEIVGVLLGLFLNVLFEELKVNGIVAGEELKVIEKEKEISLKNSPFDAFQHLWDGHGRAVISFDKF